MRDLVVRELGARYLTDLVGVDIITTTSPAFVRVPPHREHRYVAVERGQLTSTAAGA